MSTPAKPKDEAALALEKLTPQRRKFVLGYCDTFNATKAAQAAGYSPKTARTQGSQLLTILDIKAAVKAVLAKASMDPEEIAARWTALARAGLSDFYTVVEVEVKSTLRQPLAEAIASIEAEMAYEYEYMTRSWDLLGVDELTMELEEADHGRYVRRQRLEMLRLQMRLERDPAATRFIDGPKVKEQRVELDLVKAESLGMLDLIKSVHPTEFGIKVELRSPDAALDNLAKWRGMLVTKVDVTSGGEQLPVPAIVGVLSAEQTRAILEARRQVRAQQGPANE